MQASLRGMCRFFCVTVVKLYSSDVNMTIDDSVFSLTSEFSMHSFAQTALKVKTLLGATLHAIFGY